MSQRPLWWKLMGVWLFGVTLAMRELRFSGSIPIVASERDFYNTAGE